MTSGQRGALPAMGSTRPWSGKPVTQARAFMEQRTNWRTVKCGHCSKPVAHDGEWVVGHIRARATHPHLTWDPSNWRIEHRKCSNKSGQATVIEKAREQGRRDAGFPRQETPSEPPPLFSSLSDDEPHGEDEPETSRETPVQPNEDLLWTSHDLARHEWLQDLAEIPEDASAPLYMTPIPEDAVCSYAWAGCTHLQDALPAVPWIESTQKITLRWWQDLSLRRQLEHRADGSLCFRKKIESAPRRAGKSVGLRGGALWRMDVGPGLFGEPQNVIHTGSDLNICREVQRGSWNWAEAYGWSVTRGNGKEAVETTDARWLVRAQDGVYGYDCSLGLGDECWDVKPDTINEGLEPATLERVDPQIVLTSTAHRRATSLMRTELANALTMTDPAVLLLLWGAPPDCDPGDPEVWKAASPFWSVDRERMIRAKHAAALAGQDDPEFDDPDPMRGFMAQYLNVWTIAEKRLVGKPVIEAEDWASLKALVPDRAPDAVAVESWFAEGVSVAEAWRLEHGAVVVKVLGFQTLDEVARHLHAHRSRVKTLIGASLTLNRTWRDHRITYTAMSSATRAQVGELMRSLREDTLKHDGSTALSDQVLALRVSPGVDGPRIRSTERADGIKAAMWAASAAATSVRRKAAIPSRYAS